MSTTAVLLVAVWAGGAFSGLVAAASRYRYEVLRDEMKLERNPYRSTVGDAFDRITDSRKRQDRLMERLAASIFWPLAIPAVALWYVGIQAVKLAQKPGEYMARKHGLVAIKTEVKDCND